MNNEATSASSTTIKTNYYRCMGCSRKVSEFEITTIGEGNNIHRVCDVCYARGVGGAASGKLFYGKM